MQFPQKRTFILRSYCSALLLNVVVTGFGQDYAPFNDVASKRFANVLDPNDDRYYFHIVQTSINSDTIIWRQYTKADSEYIDATAFGCYPWGESLVPKSSPLWSGRAIRYIPSTGTLLHKNLDNGWLHFSFNTEINDSSIFYSNLDTNYFIIHSQTEEEEFLNFTDSVKTFEIRKYDPEGILLDSELNGFEIKLGKELGLIQFIDCYHFPESESRLILVGQTQPMAGYYQLTFDELYPWHPGDTVQFHGYNPGPELGIGTQSYQTFAVIDRIESPDSVWIFLDESLQIIQSPPWYNGGPTLMNYPDIISFRKGSAYTDKPYGMITDTGTIVTFETEDECGLHDGIYHTGSFQNYCDSCDCSIPYDGFNSTIYHSKALLGLGIIFISYEHYGPPFSDSYAHLIYNNISGVECGTYVDVSEMNNMDQLEIYPNPTRDKLLIKSQKEIASIKLDNTYGSTVQYQELWSNALQLNLSTFTRGLYLVKVQFSDESTSVHRIVID